MITEEIIKNIQSSCFDVWMRPKYPSWLFYAQNDSIEYLQASQSGMIDIKILSGLHVADQITILERPIKSLNGNRANNVVVLNR
jgi:hypothetical protein